MLKSIVACAVVAFLMSSVVIPHATTSASPREIIFAAAADIKPV
jgi:hypothetical protein